MADKQTEEDDDEGFVFGDFTSAPKTLTNHQINGSHFFTQTTNNDGGGDDDDWSDFVTFDQSPIPNSIANPSTASNSTQLTDSVTDQQVKPSTPESYLSTESKLSQNVKLRFAIPLSIFGEEEVEEEEESSAVDSSFIDQAQFFKSGLVRNDSDLNSSVEISDLIKGLYGSKGNGSEIKKDLSEQSGNGSVSKPNSNGTGVDLVNGDNQEAEGNEEDEWEWEFKGADGERDGGAANSILKENESKAVNGMAFNFETSTSWDGFNSDVVGSKTSSAMMNFDINGFKFNSAKEQDIGDDGWAFKGAEESNVKVETSVVTEDNSWDFTVAGDVSPIEVKAPKDDESKAMDSFAFNFETSRMSWGGSNSDVVGFTKNSALVNFDTNGFDLNSAKEQDDEDDSWDFKGAEESHVKLETTEGKEDDGWDFKGAEVVSHVEVAAPKDLWESSKSSHILDSAVGFTNDMFGETNLFALPNGNSHQIGNVGFSNGFTPSHASQDKILADVHPTIDPKEIKLESNPNLISAALLTPSHQEISERKQGVGRGALPLSIFGDEELGNDDSIIQSDIITSALANGPREGIKVTKTLSINDLISSLYSQSSQNDSHSIPGSSVHASNSTGMLTEENLAEEEDYFYDSWDFKGASTATSNESQAYGNCDQAQSDNAMVFAQSIAEPDLVNHDDSIDTSLWEFKDASLGMESRDFLELHQNLELDELWKFYSQLKDELHLVVLHHLDSMKKNNGLSGFMGEDAEVKVHNAELQELYNEMYKDNMMAETDSASLSGRKINLNGSLEVLREKKFQVVEAEYHLSKRLSLAETDTNSLVEVLHHVSSVLRILRLGSGEEYSNFISTWSKILSVCAKELKLGASIWKQAVDKKIQSQVLAESKGKKYILALGEMYRVVGILKASAKAYKPWVLAYSVNSSQINALLDECSILWSSSGLEEAIQSISGPLEFHYEGTVKVLLESIALVHNLDMPLLGKNTLAHSESLCQLSLLSPVSVPGMQVVLWNGKQYFLKLANLWANTVSSQPPDLPCICGG